jgi:hypothetical protein
MTPTVKSERRMPLRRLGPALVVRRACRRWLARPGRAVPYALLLVLGMLLWGRLLLKEPPRVVSAEDHVEEVRRSVDPSETSGAGYADREDREIQKTQATPAKSDFRPSE